MANVLDLEALEPTKISRDLKGKFVLLYGKPKIGKTSMSASFPRNLILATEVGYHAISGIHAVDIDSWLTFKGYLKQLKKDTIKSKFDTITIDTISLLWDLCEKYICQQNDVKALGDIAWGRGYDQCKKEFGEGLREITLQGYGLVLIAHSESRTETADNGDEIEFIAPALNKRPYAIVNQLVDIIGYIGIDNSTQQRVIYTRATPTVMAGSRFGYMRPVIPFGYQALSDALADAIEEDAAHGAVVVDAPIARFSTSTSRPFEEAMAETRAQFERLSDGPNADANMDKVAKIVETYFGSSEFRLSETKESQQELLEAVLTEMKAL